MGDKPPIEISAAAREALLGLRRQDPEPDKLALRIAVSGESDGRYLHDMSFELLADADAADVVFADDDLPVVIPADSLKKLQGASIDLAGGGEGWTIENPNRPKRMLPLAPVGGNGGHGGHDHGHEGHAHAEPASPAAAVEVPEELRASMSGDTAQRIVQVLERHINPSIAMHGGRAELAGVQESTAYMRLGGGCQGCSMAAVTLRQGIERSIKDMVPEITEVVDITDHASGDNPFYSASKG